MISSLRVDVLLENEAMKETRSRGVEMNMHISSLHLSV